MTPIAVILPVYRKDKPDWVKKSIDSILGQTYDNIALHIGVDGPVDDDLQGTLSAYSENPKVTIHPYAENRGLAIVLNDLLDVCFAAGYEYIARMDADDISRPDRFEKQISFLEQNLDIDVVGGAINEIDENGNNRGKVIIYPKTPDDCFNFFAKRNPHAHPAVLFRKSFFDKTGCKYRPEYRQNQDTMLWFDSYVAGTSHANIEDVVLDFRMSDSLFKKRRNGWKFAKKQLKDRNTINKTLGYGFGATVFGYMMFCMLVSPSCVKKAAYKLFR